MAVVIKYVVERNGVERMTFTSKKDADAYDKMLDIAESMEQMLEKIDVALSEQQVETLALEIAKNKELFMSALKGNKTPAEKVQKEKKADTSKAENVTDIKQA